MTTERKQKRRRKNERFVDLSAYELQKGEENLFDDEYGNFRQESLIYEEIELLKSKNFNDCVKIGRNLLELMSVNPSYSNINRILAHSSIQLGRTQAIKYIECL